MDSIRKNNKLIAEFMGLRIITDGISYFDEESYNPLNKYHENWNDLMPVIAKCHSLDRDGIRTQIGIRNIFSANIEICYEGVLSFIAELK